MPNPVVHFEIAGNDPQALQQYYRDLFGWNIVDASPMPDFPYGIINADEQGSGIGGGIGGAMSGDPYVTFYVEVEDIQAALDQAVELGGSVIRPVMSIPGTVTVAMFQDPEGNCVGLVVSETPPAAE